MSTALVLYMPVIHKTYLELIDSQEIDALFLIDNKLAIELVPTLRKDLRAVGAETIHMLLAKFVHPILIVTNLITSSLDVDEKYTRFIMPDEDVSHEFAKQFLNGCEVEFVNVFLRYDKKRTTEEFELNPDEIVTSAEFAKRMIARCDQLAQKSPDWWRQIGGLVVRNGEVVEELTMFNQSEPVGMNPYHVGDPRSNFKKGLNAELTTVLHTEQGIVSRAARHGISLDGADLFVTTFPCPWCAKAVAEAGFANVFYRDGYAMLDGEEILKVNNVQLIRVVE
ncbi:hypothetical protein H0W80_03685 [Candidatus Saccharibacteria bacterium]|nr:hypothetical protein [Candidatus Saccharibacteria bacterium]